MYKLLKEGNSFNIPAQLYYCDTTADFDAIKDEVPLYTKVIIIQNSRGKSEVKIKNTSGWTDVTKSYGGVGGMEIQVKTELPSTGEEGIMYLVPQNTGENDVYDEYIWVNDAFEKIGNTNTTYSEMVGATYYTDGEAGLVPAPLIANREYFLKGNGTWGNPLNFPQLDLQITDLNDVKGIGENRVGYYINYEQSGAISNKPQGVSSAFLVTVENFYGFRSTMAIQTVITSRTVYRRTMSQGADLTWSYGDWEQIYPITKSYLGLDNVENKSSSTIRSEITSSDVTTALGYTPATDDHTHNNATTAAPGFMSSEDKTKLNSITPEDLLTTDDLVVCTSEEYEAISPKTGLLYFITGEAPSAVGTTDIQSSSAAVNSNTTSSSIVTAIENS